MSQRKEIPRILHNDKNSKTIFLHVDSKSIFLFFPFIENLGRSGPYNNKLCCHRLIFRFFLSVRTSYLMLF